MRATLAQSRVVSQVRAMLERFERDDVDTHAAALLVVMRCATWLFPVRRRAVRDPHRRRPAARPGQELNESAADSAKPNATARPTDLWWSVFSNASGIISSASIVRIAPAANAWIAEIHDPVASFRRA